MVIQSDIEQFHEQGYLILPSALNDEDVAALSDGVERLIARPGPEVAREPNGAAHVIYGVHLWEAPYAALARHPAVIEVARTLLGAPYFVHQSRLNVKQTGGSIVVWHQDFATYHRVDGISDPRGLVIGVHLDDVDACNAPVVVIPRSHHGGIISEAVIDDSVPDHQTVVRYRYDIPDSTMARLVAENGAKAITGAAGTVFFMHANLVHGSSVNILPLRRAIAYINVSPCDNRGETFTRPEYYAARDFAAIEAI